MTDLISGDNEEKPIDKKRLLLVGGGVVAVIAAGVFLLSFHPSSKPRLAKTHENKIGDTHYCYTQVGYNKPVFYTLNLSEDGPLLGGVAAILGVNPAVVTGSLDDSGRIQLQMKQKYSEGLMGMDIPFMTQEKTKVFNLIGTYATKNGETRLDGTSAEQVPDGTDTPPSGDFHCSTSRPSFWGK
jgi:hypothetical protein